MSLLIGAIGIANVMFISVTERTRDRLRRALGAKRQEVLLRFLLEAAFLSGHRRRRRRRHRSPRHRPATLVVTGFSAVAPFWAPPGS